MSKEEAKDLRISVHTISKKSSPNFKREILTISSLFETYTIQHWSRTFIYTDHIGLRKIVPIHQIMKNFYSWLLVINFSYSRWLWRYKNNIFRSEWNSNLIWIVCDDFRFWYICNTILRICSLFYKCKQWFGM